MVIIWILKLCLYASFSPSLPLCVCVCVRVCVCSISNRDNTWKRILACNIWKRDQLNNTFCLCYLSYIYNWRWNLKTIKFILTWSCSLFICRDKSLCKSPYSLTISQQNIDTYKGYPLTIYTFKSFTFSKSVHYSSFKLRACFNCFSPY